LKNLAYKKPSDFIGKAVKVILKSGAAFHFKVTEAGINYIQGYDDESLDLRIFDCDIESILG
jgi:hypothetical protein